VALVTFQGGPLKTEFYTVKPDAIVESAEHIVDKLKK